MDFSPLLDEKLDEAMYMQLYRYFKEEIQSARIPAATRLPSIRQLSIHLQVSKTTVLMAYQQLLAEGYIESRERSGYYVVQLEADSLATSDSAEKQNDSQQEQEGNRILYDFFMSGIDLDHFPFDVWRKCYQQSMQLEEKDLLFYGDNQGETGLREAICQYLYQSRGVNCTAEQIVIGPSTYALVQSLCQLLELERKDVAVEDPCYPRVRDVFNRLGFQLVPIPLESDGISLERLQESNAEVVYITPSHQYPLGMVMPVAKRLKLLTWAAERDALVIEDDYDGEFRYRGKPIPSLQGLDRNGNVIYVGTFSKSLMPAIRISYMVVPQRLLGRYRSGLITYDQTASRLHQRALELFMQSGEWERHIRRMRTLYHKKHAAMLQAIKTHMGERVSITGQDAGLHLVLEVKSKESTDTLVNVAEAHGVKVYSTEPMWHERKEGMRPLLLLGFGGLPLAHIEPGIELLNRAWTPYY
ncbi:UNVERIFIED_CONTAM: GntR family transcriptional regulator/MocR family aminotransferase [Brevibacillus sp. OAP136]